MAPTQDACLTNLSPSLAPSSETRIREEEITTAAIRATFIPCRRAPKPVNEVTQQESITCQSSRENLKLVDEGAAGHVETVRNTYYDELFLDQAFWTFRAIGDAKDSQEKLEDSLAAWQLQYELRLALCEECD
jgi:hypothetical protein